MSYPIKISDNHYRIDAAMNIAPEPGQFINLKNNSGFLDPLLSRPFSIFDYDNGMVKIIFKKNGRLTKVLKQSDINNIVITTPLGKGFTLNNSKNILLIGGGVGNAPLYYLMKRLKQSGNTVHYLYAAKSSRFAYLINDYQSLSDKMFIATDDGSLGKKIFADGMLLEILKENNYDFAYTCGPHEMMKSCSKILSGYAIDHEVSLENYFGSGIGICSGCSVKTKQGMKRACVDGPVFDGDSINW